MLFKKLIFDNYKTYYGHQEVNFYIPKNVRDEKDKNIILLGGLNGAGKTTILKAILYVLFGKRGITDQEHKRLFSNVINNTFYDEGGRECSIVLTIETDQGEEWEIKIKWNFDQNKRLSFEDRSIVVRGAGLRHGRQAQIDNIDVFNRFIDKIIPYHAAPFFIFDGEEIKDIILRQNSTEMREAIHKISGIEAYKQLLKDLTSIKVSLENSLAKAISQGQLSNLNSELEKIEAELNKLEPRKLSGQTERERVEQKITILKQTRNEKLSTNSRSREVVIKKQTRLESEIHQLKEQLNILFRDHAITMILGSKIKNLKNQLKLEKDVKHKQILQEASLNPYHDFMNQLFSKPISPPLSELQLEQIKKIGENIWVKENNITEVADDLVEIHDISNKDYTYLTNLNVKDISNVIAFINKIERINLELVEIEIEIRNAPESVDISKENDEIDKLTKQVGEIGLRLQVVQRKIITAKDKKTLLLNKITRLSDQGANFEELNNQLAQVTKLITAMDEYVRKTVTMKAKFIREEFTMMLEKLFRKQGEFGKIEFDIETFTVRLYNDKNQELSIQDRSAGEMQILSSALIWALTKASDLALPMIIDTPLGRLDSYHRNHLITHYYKELSEQVIILSTDTEITEEYVTLMQDHSYRQYMLDYDEKKKYTVIRDGYFNFVRK